MQLIDSKNSEGPKKISSAQACILVFLMLFLTYAFMHQPGGPNQNSRIDALHAIIGQKRLLIDTYESNADNASFKGHYYSEKAPSITLLALPAFFIASRIISIAGLVIDKEPGWTISDWIATVGSVGLITALGGTALFAFLLRRTTKPAALVTTVALFLGAAPLPYATDLWAEAAVTGLLCISLWFLDGNEPRHSIGSGFAAGLAVAGMFPAGFAGLGLFAWSFTRGWKHGLYFVLGSIGPLLLIPAYSWAVFGSPLHIGYTFSKFSSFLHSQGFFGIVFPPIPGKFSYFLFSPARGLFFWTPFLLLAFPGYSRLQHKIHFIQFSPSILVPLAQIVAFSGYISWGGTAYGARYLSPALPFLALPAALAFEIYPRLGMVLASISVLFTGIGSSVGSFAPWTFSNPLFQFYLPELWKGNTIPSLWSALGLNGFFSLFLVTIPPLVCIYILWRYWIRNDFVLKM